ncbi:hypothetical protein AB6D60_24770 [Vibrio splendidus]
MEKQRERRQWGTWIKSVFIFFIGGLIFSSQTYAQGKKTYTWFINKPNNATSSVPSLKDLTVNDILSDEDYLSKNTKERQTGILVDGVIQPWVYHWARIEDRLDPDTALNKLNHRYTTLVRPRATLERIPDAITSPDRVRFDYWDYLEGMVFWGGSSQEGTILAPDPQWIEEAHVKGVKIYGSVFLPSLSHGGNFQDCRDLGTVSLMTKLIELADGLNFEGWFLNVESFSGEQQRETCINQIDSALSDSRITTLQQEKNIEFIKYIGSEGYSGWISDADITPNGFIEPRMKASPHSNEVDYYLISEYGAEALNEIRNPAKFNSNKQYLMFPNASYWGQLDQTTKYTIEVGARNNAEQVAKQYWEGMLGNDERKESEEYNWNGVSQYTKKRSTDAQLERFPVLAYQDINFQGSLTHLNYGRSSAEEINAIGEISSIKVGPKSYVRLCKSTDYSNCLTVWGLDLDFVGEEMNDSIVHLEVGPLELYPENVVFYTDQYFQGQKLTLDRTNAFYDTTDIYDRAFYRSISSLVVPPGKKVLLCNTRTEDSCQFPYTGTVKLVAASDNDVTRGVKIIDQPQLTLATLFAHRDQQPPLFEMLQLNHVYNASELGDVGITSSSLRLHDKQYQVKACLQSNLGGTCDIYYADSNYFGDLRNDSYRSFVIEKRDLNNVIGLAYMDLQLHGPQYPLLTGTNENFPDIFRGGISSIKLLLPGYEFSYCLTDNQQNLECTGYRSNDSLGLSSDYDDNRTLSIRIRE